MHQLFSYALEKLHAAENTLATHPGRIRERLLAAMGEGFGRVPAEALPDDLRALYEEIYGTLTSVAPQGSESPFESTLREIDEEPASRIAWRVLELVERVEDYYQENRT